MLNAPALADGLGVGQVAAASVGAASDACEVARGERVAGGGEVGLGVWPHRPSVRSAASVRRAVARPRSS